VSVRRAARDRRALLYGIFFWTLAGTVVFSRTVIPVAMKSVDQTGFSGALAALAGLIFGIVGVIVVLLVVGIIALVQLGVCHAIAKWFLGGSGTFIGILRPLSLGWPVNVLSVIPIVGPIIAFLLWAAVLMVVFEEVNHIRRLQAFAISYGVNIAFAAIGRTFLS
jgi:hypothetical protein